jgi:hypothetical protein
MTDRNLIRKDDWHHSLYQAVHPEYYCAKSLPHELKKEAAAKALAWAEQNMNNSTCVPKHIIDAVGFASESDQWATSRDRFFMHVGAIDKIRGETFWETFPELNKIRDYRE